MQEYPNFDRFRVAAEEAKARNLTAVGPARYMHENYELVDQRGLTVDLEFDGQVLRILRKLHFETTEDFILSFHAFSKNEGYDFFFGSFVLIYLEMELLNLDEHEFLVKLLVAFYEENFGIPVLIVLQEAKEAHKP